MSRKFKALFLTHTILLLSLTLNSISVWAQVTINPGDILAVDPGSVGGSGAVIRIDPATGVQTVVSSRGLFQEPSGIAIEADGNILVSDRISGIIRVNPQTGTQTLVHAGPPIIDTFGIALEADGSIVVADTGCRSHSCFTGGPRGQAIYRVNPSTGAVTTVSSGVFLDSPYSIDVEANGNILVTDSTSNVAPLTQGGIIRINPVTGNQTVVSQGRQDFACPFGIAIEPNGRILNSVFTFAGYGCSPGALFRADPAIDQNTVVSPHSIGWQAPFGMAVDTDGSIVVAEEFYRAIFRVNPNTGTPTLLSQDGFLIGPSDVAIARPAASGADVSVTKTDGVTTVTAGDGVTYTYTITVRNQGTLAATGVTLTDSWPSAFIQGAITASQGSCNSSGGNFTCSIGNLAVGASVTVTVNYTVPSTAPAGTQTNTASVSSTTPDSNTSNNSASDINTVVLNANLSLTKTDGVSTMRAGDGITRTYTMTVNNAGPSQATGVTLTDSWPSGFSQGTITASQGTCTSGGNFTCSLGNLAAGGSATVSVSYTVPGTTPSGTQTNTASVSSATPDSDTSNNSASDTNTVTIGADLSVTKTDGVATVVAGDGVTRTYTITVQNAGPAQATAVSLTDSWPGAFVRGATTTSQGSCTSGSGSFTCSLGDLAVGASATVTASYTVPATAPAGTQTNTASVTSTTTDSDTTNNTASDTNTVTTAATDLSVTKTDGVATVVAGDGVTRTYTITVQNAGPAQATAVSLTDSWPGAFVRGATTTSQGSCASGGGNFTCSLGDLAAGASATVTASYTVPATAPAGTQTNTASVTSATADSNTSNNSASDSTAVTIATDLSVTKTDGVATVVAGDGVTRTYTITVQNAGPAQATAVSLTDSWPGAFIRGATTTSQGSCTSGSGSFTCSLGDLAAGASATVTVNYTVPSTAPAGTQTNTASVTSTTPDSNTSNNSASDTNTVTVDANLSVTKTDGVATVTAGDGVTRTYTITVRNGGPSLATAVNLSDAWPGGFTRGTTTTSQGSCTPGGGSFTCSLGNLAAGASATVTVNYTVPSTAPAGTQTNTASVTSTTPDSVTGNNSASDTTTIITSADLSVTKTDGLTSVTLLGGGTYTITVRNSGPSRASGVTLSDTWPAGFSRGTTTTSQGTCTGGNDNFTCSLGDVAAGASVTITVNYTVRLGTLPGAQTNAVTVTSGTSDPNAGNNTASDTTNVTLL
jgi:uncharacterized repeat protein (TIGR01451 family)